MPGADASKLGMEHARELISGLTGPRRRRLHRGAVQAASRSPGLALAASSRRSRRARGPRRPPCGRSRSGRRTHRRRLGARRTRSSRPRRARSPLGRPSCPCGRDRRARNTPGDRPTAQRVVRHDGHGRPHPTRRRAERPVLRIAEDRDRIARVGLSYPKRPGRQAAHPEDSDVVGGIERDRLGVETTRARSLDRRVVLACDVGIRHRPREPQPSRAGDRQPARRSQDADDARMRGPRPRPRAELPDSAAQRAREARRWSGRDPLARARGAPARAARSRSASGGPPRRCASRRSRVCPGNCSATAPKPRRERTRSRCQYESGDRIGALKRAEAQRSAQASADRRSRCLEQHGQRAGADATRGVYGELAPSESRCGARRAPTQRSHEDADRRQLACPGTPPARASTAVGRANPSTIQSSLVSRPRLAGRPGFPVRSSSRGHLPRRLTPPAGYFDASPRRPHRRETRRARDDRHDDRAFIERCDMVFVATADADGRPNCSYKGGDLASSACSTRTIAAELRRQRHVPLHGQPVVDARRPALHQLRGAQAAAVERRRVDLRGRPAGADHPEAQFVVRVRADQVFPNCPRFIHRYQLVERSRFVPKAACETPVPAWKTREWSRDAFLKTIPRAIPHARSLSAGSPATISRPHARGRSSVG